MTPAVNGHDLAEAPRPDPRWVVAKAIYETAAGADGAPFDSLDDDERVGFLDAGAAAMAAHAAWLVATGHRIAPPGSVLQPTSEADAKAMFKAASEFMKARNRKGGLLAVLR